MGRGGRERKGSKVKMKEIKRKNTGRALRERDRQWQLLAERGKDQ